MSLESVRAYLAKYAPDIEIAVAETESSTVALAAAAFGVPPERIAKTLALRAAVRVFLVVAGGLARLDNRKAKARFGGKVTMLGPDEVERLTGHPPGGVCPFGLATPLPV
jgi:prolyl-tRNA editing enzyme YbaK/EbsC (Cys-tRNA(Pro) deacylase)